MSRPTNPKWQIYVGSGIDDLSLSCKARSLLMHLARRVGKDNAWQGSADVMAKRLGMKRDTVFKAIKELEAAELVTRHKQFKGMNIYSLTSPRKGDDSSIDLDSLSSPKEGLPSSPQKGLPQSPKGGQYKGIPFKGIPFKEIPSTDAADAPPELPMEIETKPAATPTPKPTKRKQGGFRQYSEPFERIWKYYSKTHRPGGKNSAADAFDTWPKEMQEDTETLITAIGRIAKAELWATRDKDKIKMFATLINSGDIQEQLEQASNRQQAAPTTDNPTHKPKGKSFLPATLEATTQP